MSPTAGISTAVRDGLLRSCSRWQLVCDRLRPLKMAPECRRVILNVDMHLFMLVTLGLRQGT